MISLSAKIHTQRLLEMPPTCWQIGKQTVPSTRPNPGNNQDRTRPGTNCWYINRMGYISTATCQWIFSSISMLWLHSSYLGTFQEATSQYQRWDWMCQVQAQRSLCNSLSLHRSDCSTTALPIFPTIHTVKSDSTSEYPRSRKYHRWLRVHI